MVLSVQIEIYIKMDGNGWKLDSSAWKNTEITE